MFWVSASKRISNYQDSKMLFRSLLEFRLSKYLTGKYSKFDKVEQKWVKIPKNWKKRQNNFMDLNSVQFTVMTWFWWRRKPTLIGLSFGSEFCYGFEIQRTNFQIFSKLKCQIFGIQRSGNWNNYITLSSKHIKAFRKLVASSNRTRKLIEWMNKQHDLTFYYAAASSRTIRDNVKYAAPQYSVANRDLPSLRRKMFSLYVVHI